MENPDILATWKLWQVAKHESEKAEKAFRRVAAVMGVWLEDGHIQFMDPDKAWEVIVEKACRKALCDESLDRLDTPTKGLFKWAKEQRANFEAARKSVARLEENFTSACEQAGLNPDKIAESLLRKWELTTPQWKSGEANEED
jgi:hypothetical protein